MTDNPISSGHAFPLYMGAMRCVAALCGRARTGISSHGCLSAYGKRNAVYRRA